MLHEFMVVVMGKFEEPLPDAKSMIDMSRIEAAHEGMAESEIGKTVLMLQSGNAIVVCTPYEEFLYIWKTCVEPININQ